MKIISVSKKKNKIIVLFDNDEKLELAYDVFLYENIFEGDEIDEIRFRQILKKNEIYFIKNSAFRYLSIRDHSRLELFRKLNKKYEDRDLINSVLNDLTEKQYLNDAKFAEAFIEERVTKRKLGLNKVRVELLKKGIDRKIIENKLFFDEELLEINALDLASKKLRSLKSSSKKFDEKKIRQKIYSFLLTKGYNPEIIRNVIDKIEPDE